MLAHAKGGISQHGYRHSPVTSLGGVRQATALSASSISSDSSSSCSQSPSSWLLLPVSCLSSDALQSNSAERCGWLRCRCGGGWLLPLRPPCARLRMACREEPAGGSPGGNLGAGCAVATVQAASTASALAVPAPSTMQPSGGCCPRAKAAAVATAPGGALASGATTGTSDVPPSWPSRIAGLSGSVITTAGTAAAHELDCGCSGRSPSPTRAAAAAALLPTWHGRSAAGPVALCMLSPGAAYGMDGPPKSRAEGWGTPGAWLGGVPTQTRTNAAGVGSALGSSRAAASMAAGTSTPSRLKAGVSCDPPMACRSTRGVSCMAASQPASASSDWVLLVGAAQDTVVASRRARPARARLALLVAGGAEAPSGAGPLMGAEFMVGTVQGGAVCSPGGTTCGCSSCLLSCSVLPPASSTGCNSTSDSPAALADSSLGDGCSSAGAGKAISAAAGPSAALGSVPPRLGRFETRLGPGSGSLRLVPARRTGWRFWSFLACWTALRLGFMSLRI